MQTVDERITVESSPETAAGATRGVILGWLAIGSMAVAAAAAASDADVYCFALCVFERRIAVVVAREKVIGASYRVSRVSMLALGLGLHWSVGLSR
jgi:hypothetical protein